MASLTLEAAVSIAQTHAYNKVLDQRAYELLGSTLRSIVTAEQLIQSTEYPFGWVLIFRVKRASRGQQDVTVMVRDDDTLYWYGLTNANELREMGRVLPGANFNTLTVSREQFLNPPGNVPRMFGPNTDRSLPPGSHRYS